MKTITGLCSMLLLAAVGCGAGDASTDPFHTTAVADDGGLEGTYLGRFNPYDGIDMGAMTVTIKKVEGTKVTGGFKVQHDKNANFGTPDKDGLVSSGDFTASRAGNTEFDGSLTIVEASTQRKGVGTLHAKINGKQIELTLRIKYEDEPKYTDNMLVQKVTRQ
jgi:hypothetical protein